MREIYLTLNGLPKELRVPKRRLSDEAHRAGSLDCYILESE